ncbi:hypothetical protein M378DRAFT_165047 [Amanita muscaria Koide BX008]|uniref:Uncharacterized protein n=1 Tax=Amanita muscaria (strain Koide BX008) TaxID=946122 RepID=A0A0C2T8M1_AMAMK|nr:hypothetical protein M378DRAFT_165047 [Amanita muscaria Koide BX008]
MELSSNVSFHHGSIVNLLRTKPSFHYTSSTRDNSSFLQVAQGVGLIKKAITRSSPICAYLESHGTSSSDLSNHMGRLGVRRPRTRISADQSGSPISYLHKL